MAKTKTGDKHTHTHTRNHLFPSSETKGESSVDEDRTWLLWHPSHLTGVVLVALKDPTSSWLVTWHWRRTFRCCKSGLGTLKCWLCPIGAAIGALRSTSSIRSGESRLILIKPSPGTTSPAQSEKALICLVLSGSSWDTNHSHYPPDFPINLTFRTIQTWTSAAAGRSRPCLPSLLLGCAVTHLLSCQMFYPLTPSSPERKKAPGRARPPLHIWVDNGANNRTVQMWCSGQFLLRPCLPFSFLFRFESERQTRDSPVQP